MSSRGGLADALVGVWVLETYVVFGASGDLIDVPFGPKPIGMITYLPSGQMSVHAMAAGRRQCAVARPRECSPLSKMTAFDSYFGYSGGFEVAGNLVRHYVRVSSFPDWTGRVLCRAAEIDGDVLRLTGADPQGASVRIPVLTWRREA